MSRLFANSVLGLWISPGSWLAL